MSENQSYIRITASLCLNNSPIYVSQHHSYIFITASLDNVLIHVFLYFIFPVLTIICHCFVFIFNLNNCHGWVLTSDFFKLPETFTFIFTFRDHQTIEIFSSNCFFTFWSIILICQLKSNLLFPSITLCRLNRQTNWSSICQTSGHPCTPVHSRDLYPLIGLYFLLFENLDHWLYFSS